MVYLHWSSSCPHPHTGIWEGGEVRSGRRGTATGADCSSQRFTFQVSFDIFIWLMQKQLGYGGGIWLLRVKCVYPQKYLYRPLCPLTRAFSVPIRLRVLSCPCTFSCFTLHLTCCRGLTTFLFWIHNLFYTLLSLSCVLEPIKTL